MLNNSNSSTLVFISGAHSVGKTTLVDALEKTDTFSSWQKIPEIARLIIQENGWTRYDFNLIKKRDNFKTLNLRILKRLCKILNELKSTGALFDRGPDPLVYIRFYLSEEEYQDILQLEETKYCIEKFQNSFIFIPEPHEGFIHDDGVRIMSTIQELTEFTKIMYKTLDELKIPYVIIRDTDLSKRVDFVSRHVIKVHNS